MKSLPPPRRTTTQPCQAGAGTIASAFAPRARRIAIADELPVLRWHALQTRGDDHRDAGELPRTYKVIQTVREKFSCRSCETITQPPAPFHVIARGCAGPDLLATIMHAKFGEHQPLNRQSERFFREGIDLGARRLGGCLHDSSVASGNAD